jgi:hypothetical protein
MLRTHRYRTSSSAFLVSHARPGWLRDSNAVYANSARKVGARTSPAVTNNRGGQTAMVRGAHSGFNGFGWNTAAPVECSCHRPADNPPGFRSLNFATVDEHHAAATRRIASVPMQCRSIEIENPLIRRKCIVSVAVPIDTGFEIVIHGDLNPDRISTSSARSIFGGRWARKHRSGPGLIVS